MGEFSANVRKEVSDRAQGRCEYCRIPSQGQVAWFPIDHIKPRTKGGESTLANLALACPRCNGHKWKFDSAIDPESGEEVPLFDPRSQAWEEHFAWAADSTLRIEGRTATGRATVERLKMNDAEIAAIRQLLMELGIDVM